MDAVGEEIVVIPETGDLPFALPRDKREVKLEELNVPGVRLRDPPEVADGDDESGYGLVASISDIYWLLGGLGVRRGSHLPAAYACRNEPQSKLSSLNSLLSLFERYRSLETPSGNDDGVSEFGSPDMLTTNPIRSRLSRLLFAAASLASWTKADELAMASSRITAVA